MIINIPLWTITDITHYATTWRLYSDESCTILEDSLEETTTDLTSWKSDKLIPTGSIWYVKALRYLKDSSGNNINNTEWIGPKPIINNDSNINDYLSPKYFIKEPYIKSFDYLPTTGISLTLEPYSGNVGYVTTTLYLKDENDKDLYVNTYDINTNQTIDVSSLDVNFYKVNVLKVYVVHSGNHSVISKVYKEIFHLKDVYYKILGNTVSIDPYTPNTLEIKSTNITPVIIKEAKLITTNGSFISSCEYKDDVLTIPNILEFNSSYNIDVTFSYTDNNNVIQEKKDTIYITTRNNDEKEYIDSNFKYEYIIKKVNSITPNSVYDLVKTSINFNTEELYTNLIPYIGNSNDVINFYIYDKNENLPKINKININTLNENYTIRLVTKNKGYIQTTLNGILVLNFFDYDAFKDTITITNTINTTLISLKSDMIKIAEVGNKNYLVGINNINTKEIIVYEVDIINGTLNQLYTYMLDDDATEITVVPYLDSNILITPIGLNLNRNLLYSTIENFIIVFNAIPINFINKNQYVTRLKNGSIFGIKMEILTNVLEFYIIDIYNNIVSVKQSEYLHTGSIKNITKLKNGSLLFYIDGVNKKHIYELV